MPIRPWLEAQHSVHQRPFQRREGRSYGGESLRVDGFPHRVMGVRLTFLLIMVLMGMRVGIIMMTSQTMHTVAVVKLADADLA